MHSLVTNQNGAPGEFVISGRATPVLDPAVRAVAAAAAPYDSEDSYVLFELTVEAADSTAYEGDQPARRRWRAP